MFKVVNQIEPSTHRVGEISLNYQDIVNAIGEPEESDGYKVSGEWYFLNEETGAVFTLYDWKSTSLYSDDLPSVGEFRSYTGNVQFNIGGTGNDDVDDFKQKLIAQISWVKNGSKACEELLLEYSQPIIGRVK